MPGERGAGNGDGRSQRLEARPAVRIPFAVGGPDSHGKGTGSQ